MIAVGEPLRPAPTRGRSGRILLVEDFSSVLPGIWNDGVGFVESDCDITFGGLPTLLLDTNGQSTGAMTNPGRTAATSGVVIKRRIHDGYRSIVGVEAWFRLTSLNNTSNSKLSMSIYNRDGTNAHHFRVWLDPNGNNTPMHGRILDGLATNTVSGTNGSGAATYADVITSVSQNGGGSHLYDLPSGREDRAGGWHYAKMVVNFATLRYVSLQLDAETVDISGYLADITASTGMAGMHMSFEFSGQTTTPRYINIANMVATLEGE